MDQERKPATEVVSNFLFTPLIWRPLRVVFGFTLVGGGLLLGIWGLFSAGQEAQTAMIRSMHFRGVRGAAENPDFSLAQESGKAAEINAVRWKEVVGGLALFVSGGCLLAVGFRPPAGAVRDHQDRIGIPTRDEQHEGGPPVELDWRSQPPANAGGRSQ